MKEKRKNDLHIRLTDSELNLLSEIREWRTEMGLKGATATDIIVAMLKNYHNKIKPYSAMLRQGINKREIRRIIKDRYKNQVEEELQRERDKQSTIKFDLDNNNEDLPF